MNEAKVPASARRLAHNLKSFRKEQGLTQDALAEMSSTTRQTIISIEKGASDTHLSMVQRLADALCIDVVELLW